jgi:hypothetical protein
VFQFSSFPTSAPMERASWASPPNNSLYAPAAPVNSSLSTFPQASPSKRKLDRAAEILPKMARIDLGGCSDRHASLLESCSNAATWHSLEKSGSAASTLSLPSPHEEHADHGSVEAFVLGVMRTNAVHVSAEALNFSSHAVLDMISAAQRRHHQAGLALVPYKASGDVVMESLTAFQQKEKMKEEHRSRQLCQQHNQIHHQHHHQQQQQQQIGDYNLRPPSPDALVQQHPAHKRRRLTPGAECCHDGAMDDM